MWLAVCVPAVQDRIGTQYGYGRQHEMSILVVEAGVSLSERQFRDRRRDRGVVFRMGIGDLDNKIFHRISPSGRLLLHLFTSENMHMYLESRRTSKQQAVEVE